MNIAAIALASAFAATLGFAQTASAQQNYGQPNYGSQQGSNNNQGNQGPMGGNQNSGPMMNNPNPQWNGNWHNGPQAQNQNWNQGQNRNWTPGWRHMHDGNMEGHMGMWHHRAFDRGTSFTFGNGKARIFVHCGQSQSLQDCTNAANQLLDQIASSHSNNDTHNSGTSNSSTNGLGSNSSTPGSQGSMNSSSSSNDAAASSGSKASPDPGGTLQNGGQYLNNSQGQTPDQDDSESEQ